VIDNGFDVCLLLEGVGELIMNVKKYWKNNAQDQMFD